MPPRIIEKWKKRFMMLADMHSKPVARPASTDNQIFKSYIESRLNDRLKTKNFEKVFLDHLANEDIPESEALLPDETYEQSRKYAQESGKALSGLYKILSLYYHDINLCDKLPRFSEIVHVIPATFINIWKQIHIKHLCIKTKEVWLNNERDLFVLMSDWLMKANDKLMENTCYKSDDLGKSRLLGKYFYLLNFKGNFIELRENQNLKSGIETTLGDDSEAKETYSVERQVYKQLEQQNLLVDFNRTQYHKFEYAVLKQLKLTRPSQFMFAFSALGKDAIDKCERRTMFRRDKDVPVLDTTEKTDIHGLFQLSESNEFYTFHYCVWLMLLEAIQSGVWPCSKYYDSLIDERALKFVLENCMHPMVSKNQCIAVCTLAKRVVAPTGVLFHARASESYYKQLRSSDEDELTIGLGYRFMLNESLVYLQSILRFAKNFDKDRLMPFWVQDIIVKAAVVFDVYAEYLGDSVLINPFFVSNQDIEILKSLKEMTKDCIKTFQVDTNGIKYTILPDGFLQSIRLNNMHVNSEIEYYKNLMQSIENDDDDDKEDDNKAAEQYETAIERESKERERNANKIEKFNKQSLCALLYLLRRITKVIQVFQNTKQKQQQQQQQQNVTGEQIIS